MQHNQAFTAEELQKEARRAIETAEGETQSSVARKLGVTRNAIHLALTTDTPSRYARILGRIIATLSDYEIEATTVYRAVRKRK